MFSATILGVPITPIYGFGAKRWVGYESLSGSHALGMVYPQYVPPAMEPGVVVEMAKLIPQPVQVCPRGQGPFLCPTEPLGYVRYQKIGPFFEPSVVRRMAKDLDVPMMAGAFGQNDNDTLSFKDVMITIGVTGVAFVVGVSAVYWFAREMARG